MQRGDCLWTIAKRVLGTDDAPRVARYVLRIYRANRSIIDDPDLIYPDQRLRLPTEKD